MVYKVAMATRQPLPISFLRECFGYNPVTGLIAWKQRPASHFPTDEAAAAWNVQNAGARAFAKPDKSGYCRAEVRFEGRRLRLTGGRVAFALLHGWLPHIVDHEDGDTTNNRGRNLRAATDEQNMWNRRKGKDRGGLPRGAYFERGKWRSSVTHKRKKVHLGAFDTPEEAHRAYAAFVQRERGQFNYVGGV